MKETKLIIFDLDGTLVDAYPAIIESFNYAMEVLGYPRRKDSIIRRAVGWGDSSLLKPFVREEDLNKAVLIYRKHHKGSLLKHSKTLPFARELLGYLKKKGYKLAVASNRPSFFSGILIRHLGLGRYLDYTLCADRLKKGKPHPEILKRIMRRFSVKPRQALYVGDMAIDAQAGRRAKIKTIIVTTGSSLKSEIKEENPYRIIGAIRDLKAFL